MKWITRPLTLVLLVLSLGLAPPLSAEPDESASSSEVILINSASLEDLTKLKGVGKAKALAIIEYRKANGDFTSLDELLLVKGIGQSTIKKNKEIIRFD